MYSQIRTSLGRPPSRCAAASAPGCRSVNESPIASLAQGEAIRHGVVAQVAHEERMGDELVLSDQKLVRAGIGHQADAPLLVGPRGMLGSGLVLAADGLAGERRAARGGE